MLIQIAAAFFAILFISVVMNVPKKYLIYCGAVGATGWCVYLAGKEAFGVMIGSFMGAVVVSLISHILARVQKAPVTVFLIPGFLTLLPGSSLYYAVYQFFTGSEREGINYLIQTIQIAGVIAFGVFVVDSVFDVIRKNSLKKGDKYVQKECKKDI